MQRRRSTELFFILEFIYANEVQRFEKKTPPPFSTELSRTESLSPGLSLTVDIVNSKAAWLCYSINIEWVQRGEIRVLTSNENPM